MRLPKDLLSGAYRKPNVYLCETDKKRICGLETINMSASLKFNSYSELTFTVPRTYINMTTGETKTNPHYDKIEALRLIYLEGFGYFEIQDPEIESDGIREVKNITAYSLEYTLAQKYLEGFKINTGEVDSLEVVEAGEGGLVKPIILYKPEAPNLSLLHIILEKAYGWKIGHVDGSLQYMGRTFEISRVSIYDFIVQEICDKFNCFAVFDTINNTINLYAETLITKHIGDGFTRTFTISPAYSSLGSVSIDGYKTTAYTYEIQKNNNTEIGILTFNDTPKNGAIIEIKDGSQQKWETDVYVSFDNLAQEVNVSYSADNIRTVLTVKGADDMDIREVNMGLPYIVDLSYYYTVDWMGQDLYKAYTTYLQNCNNGQEEYQQNAQRMILIDGLKSYEENRLSLQYSIADNVTNTTVGTYYVRGGTSPDYYYTEVKLPDEWASGITYYMLSGSDLDTTKFSNFYEAVKTYFVSKDSRDTSAILDLKDSFVFMETYTIDHLVSDLNKATTTEEKKNAIMIFLDELWDQLGLSPLKKLYYESYKKIKETNEEAGWNSTSHNNYWNYYPVTIVIDSLDKEISDREKTISDYQSEYDRLSNRNVEISNSALIYNYFTHDQLVRLSPFLREDEYTDDNFVETEMDSIDTIMQTKKELRECGRMELAKLCEPKLEFSMSMANIYALPEFEPIVDQFQLGNLINVVIRNDYIKRARLLEVNINFDDFSDFTCEFGELTSLRTQSSIHADLLASAITAGKSVASNASYWNQSSDSVTSLALQIHQGLLDAATVIKAIDGEQGVSIDKYGIHLQKFDSSTGELDPKEGWIVNNQFLYSDDNFKTAKSVFGEYTIGDQTKWGLLAEAVMAGYLAGCTIEGGTIDIGNGTFVVDQFGNVTMRSSSIDGYVTSNKMSEIEADLSARITATEKGISAQVSKDSIISIINQSAESVTINANKISLTGKTINLTSDDIAIKSTNFSVTNDGQITATSGKIAGWTIYEGVLRKETVVDNVTYQMYMQASDGVSTTNAFVVRKRNPDVSSWDTQFAVSYAGKMTAKNANITGTITAKDGSIAGYNIGPGGVYENAIYKRVAGSGDGYNYEVGMKATSGTTDLAFYVKSSKNNWITNENNFFIRNNGHLYAKSADITGKITASSGTIGSWTIGDLGTYTDSIYSTYCAASTASSTNPEYAVFMRGKGSSSTNIAIGVKKRTSSSTAWTDAENPFYVRKDGYVFMTNANVTGTVNATAGTIGGCSISNGVLNINAANITSGTISTARIPNLSADKITAGTINADRIPNISASKITSGTISTSRLDSSVITTNNFSAKTLSTSSLTMASGCRLGVASECNAKLYSSGGYTWMEAFTSSNSSYLSSIMNIVRAGVNVASTREIKHEIHDFDDRYDVFFDSLNPQLFKYNFESDMGYSMGFIWEDARASMYECGLSDNDLGAIHESEGTIGGKVLRKDDFVALNTWQIQKLKTRIEELENKLAALEV